MNATGARIRARRLDAGMSQRDLAQAVGISPSYLNLIEHDRRRVAGKLVGRIADHLSLDPVLLSEGADTALINRMRMAAAALSTTAVEVAQAEDLATRYPGWSRLIAAQARQIAALDGRVKVLSDRISHDPALAAALHGVITAVTAIQSSAAILTGETPLDADWQARFHRNINADAGRLAETTAALVACFDAPLGAGGDPVAGDAASPLAQMERTLAKTGFHRPELEAGGAESTTSLTGGGALADVLRDHDERYIADALALPLDVIGLAARDADYDPLRLAAQLGRPLAQVMRRLATLPDAPPLGVLQCDAAGVVTLMKAVPGFAVPRDTLCPFWPVFTALGQPGRPVVARVALAGPSESRLTCYALAEVVPHPAGPYLPPLIAALMLVRPDDPATAAADPSPPVPVGPGCAICPRQDCPARREPAVAGVQEL
ncbi:helix-turn-helix domain-containing protein [Loktanella sp. M215]|uniref:helix-turn-helix domain-containing protein n=1 Tax=Loktanella sp. M215 TaxID=2675431 RepID=UPI001F3B6244|nr:XRE family transcriptional regulator [Loktanella sp. M215]MCF7699818.1 helix-turn-helix domain-containing protein [Loktanella sp. M215]